MISMAGTQRHKSQVAVHLGMVTMYIHIDNRLRSTESHEKIVTTLVFHFGWLHIFFFFFNIFLRLFLINFLQYKMEQGLAWWCLELCPSRRAEEEVHVQA
jgi:small neutral amino acid transporter SnatA (MarC family)